MHSISLSHSAFRNTKSQLQHGLYIEKQMYKPSSCSSASLSLKWKVNINEVRNDLSLSYQGKPCWYSFGVNRPKLNEGTLPTTVDEDEASEHSLHDVRENVIDVDDGHIEYHSKESPHEIKAATIKMSHIEEDSLRSPGERCPLYQDVHFYLDFCKLKTLGSGTFGEVRLVQHKTSAKQYAAKVFYKEGHHLHRKGDFCQEEIYEECVLMAQLEHPNIVRLEAVYDEADRCTFVMELARGGELRSYLRQFVRKTAEERKRYGRTTVIARSQNEQDGDSPDVSPNIPCSGAASIQLNMKEGFRDCGDYALLSEKEIAHYFVDAVAAVAYLHQRNIAHRDVKLENLLRRDECPYSDILICDFGFAAQAPPSGRFKDYCGSLFYVAPEVLVMKNEYRLVAEQIGFSCSSAQSMWTPIGSQLHRSSQPSSSEPAVKLHRKYDYDRQCDMWSLGVCLYALLTAEQPFRGKARADIVYKIMLGQFNENSVGWKTVSPEAQTLVKSLLHLCPDERPTAEELLRDNVWLQRHARERVQQRLIELNLSLNVRR